MSTARFQFVRPWIFAAFYACCLAALTFWAYWNYPERFFESQGFRICAMWAVFIPGNLLAGHLTRDIRYILLTVIVWLGTGVLFAYASQILLLATGMTSIRVVTGFIFISAFIVEGVFGTIRLRLKNMRTADDESSTSLGDWER